MSGLNKIMIIGNVGNDPEIRYTQSKLAVTNLSMATNETWKDKDSGEKKERTEWHRVVFYGALATIVSEHVKTGHKLYVEGSVRTKEWLDNAGVKRYTTEIIAKNMLMLERPKGEPGPSTGPIQAPPVDDGDIPF